MVPEAIVGSHARVVCRDMRGKHVGSRACVVCRDMQGTCREPADVVCRVTGDTQHVRN